MVLLLKMKFTCQKNFFLKNKLLNILQIFRTGAKRINSKIYMAQSFNENLHLPRNGL